VVFNPRRARVARHPGVYPAPRDIEPATDSTAFHPRSHPVRKTRNLGRVHAVYRTDIRCPRPPHASSHPDMAESGRIWHSSRSCWRAVAAPLAPCSGGQAARRGLARVDSSSRPTLDARHEAGGGEVNVRAERSRIRGSSSKGRLAAGPPARSLLVPRVGSAHDARSLSLPPSDPAKTKHSSTSRACAPLAGINITAAPGAPTRGALPLPRRGPRAAEPGLGQDSAAPGGSRGFRLRHRGSGGSRTAPRRVVVAPPTGTCSFGRERRVGA
jgi:hypothetical protein